jgi:phosphate transport system permease protein
MTGLLIACVVLSMGVLVVLLVDVSPTARLPSPSFLTDLPSRIIPADSGSGPRSANAVADGGVRRVHHPRRRERDLPRGVREQENRINRFIGVNIQNLAAVPSIVCRILGLAFLVRGPIGMGRI